MTLSTGRSIGPESSATARHSIDGFRKFAERTGHWLGSSTAFMVAVTFVLAWAISGPLFGFSDRWQIIINTCTSIVTFLMVFLLQGTQTRDLRVLQLKLDELLRAVQEARTGLVRLEHLPDAHLNELAEEFARLGEEEGNPAPVASAQSPDAESPD